MKKNMLILAALSAISFITNGQSIAPKLEQAVMAFVNQDKFTGTVLVAKQGKIILHKGYGFKNAETQMPNSINTIYQIASLAKQFTAAVVLKLQEQGKLSVQDKLSKYYPDYPHGDKITIHHLLSHTSGVYNYTDNKEFMSADQFKPVTHEYMIKQFSNKPLAFEPGTKFSYSNSGYTLLGYIIEKITSKPYREVLENLILKPLKLRNSGYDYSLLKDTAKSTGYSQYGISNYKAATYIHPSVLYTTGALYSTASDLYNWHKALMHTSFYLQHH